MGRTPVDRRPCRSLLAAILAIAASVVLLTPGIALADLRFHGGSEVGPAACSGCHRTHTAIGGLTWRGAAYEERDALPPAATGPLSDYCFSCHGSATTGAATNVFDGVYESNEHGTPGAGLNGGAFGHHVAGGDHHPYDGDASPACGGPDGVVMTCATCHDFHGSSNYRLLKDVVNGVRVGGCIETAGGELAPDPFVISNEPGYPAGGWVPGAGRAAQMAAYDPDYSTPMYAKAPGEDPARGISAWCAACHPDHRGAEASGRYDAGDGLGDVTRLGHPVNVPLSAYQGPRPICVTGLALPLAHEPGSRTPEGRPSDWIDCLTCHRAHGSDAAVTGLADVVVATDVASGSGAGMASPAVRNALLRLDARGVCEACHNK